MSTLSERHHAILAGLMAGNKRYMEGAPKGHNLVAQRSDLVEGQSPPVAVIRCADSRVSPELVFDVGLGEIFVCGVAGNIPTPEIMASLEYAVSNLGTELILVMGHSHCGAVGAAVSNQDQIHSLPGNLPGLLSQILPSVQACEELSGDLTSNAIRQNAVDAARRVIKMSTPIEAAAKEGSLGIASGVYDLATGHFDLNSS